MVSIFYFPLSARWVIRVGGKYFALWWNYGTSRVWMRRKEVACKSYFLRLNPNYVGISIVQKLASTNSLILVSTMPLRLSRKGINICTRVRMRKIFGIIFIVLGFLALIMPLTPGAWLIFVGLELLGFTLINDKIRGWWKRLRNKDTENPRS